MDEPESSLHISKCYEQFAKINNIAIEHHHQIFLTTHWYGSLPVLKCGGLTHIDDRSKPSYNEISNYFENRGDLPNDVQLKGYFDLTSSLLYAFRNSKHTMILVEGYEDKRYIEYYIRDKNLTIVPVGGCTNVKKIFSYLYTPLSDKEMIPLGGTRKIICLIDTDIKCPTIGIETDVDSNVLTMRRLHQENGADATIIKCTDDRKNPTEIEEVLEPKPFYDSLKCVIDECGSDEVKQAFGHFIFNPSVNISRISGDYSILKQNELDIDVANDKSTISSFIDSHKEDIALKYVSVPKTGSIPNWIVELKTLCDSQLRK